MGNKYYKCKYIYVLFVLFLISCSPLSFCETKLNGELILFPYLDAEFNFDLDDISSPDNDEFGYGVDLFATFEIGKIRFLGEYLLSRNEQEFERLQLGWLFDDHNKVWLGRFHNPVGFWNTNYHHGDYLETSISRPAIIEFEDEGGIFTMHLAGLLYEGLIAKDEGGLGYVLALAAGTELTEGELETWDPLKPGSGKHDISATINLYYEPELYAPTRFGVFANYSELPAESIAIDEVQQIIAGVYGNWESAPWHIIASFYYIHNHFSLSASSPGSAFMHAYMQSEYEMSNKWAVYGRIEATMSEKNDLYLALFPEFIEDRVLGGIRFELANQNALKLEISENHTSSDDFYQLILQWSAVF